MTKEGIKDKYGKTLMKAAECLSVTDGEINRPRRKINCRSAGLSRNNETL